MLAFSIDDRIDATRVRRHTATTMYAAAARIATRRAHRCVVTTARAASSSASQVAPVWTGEEDDRARSVNAFTRFGTPEAQSFAHIGVIAAANETKVRYLRAYGAFSRARVCTRARGGSMCWGWIDRSGGSSAGFDLITRLGRAGVVVRRQISVIMLVLHRLWILVSRSCD